MDEDGAVKNVTQKIEKKIKPKSKKGENNEESAMGIQEANIGVRKEIEHVQISREEDFAETKMGHKRDKDKLNKGSKDAVADMKNGAKEGELTIAYDNDGNGDAINAERKKKKRENWSKKDNVETGSSKEVEGNESEKRMDGESISGMKSSREAKEERKKGKAKINTEDGEFEEEREIDGKEVETQSQNCGVHAMEMVERKKRKKDTKKSKDDEGDISSLQQENVPDSVKGNIESTKHDGNTPKERKRKMKHKKKENYKDDSCAAQQDYVDNNSNGLMHTDEIQSNELESANKRKRKRTQVVENGSDALQDNGVECENNGKKKKTKLVESGSNDATPNKSNKKVRFSGQDEVFPLPGDSNTWKENEEEDNLVRGKRFTREEDEIVKKAVCNYILEHDLGDEGLNMVLNCRKHPMVKGCWKEITSAIPYRPYTSIYYRAQILLRRSETRKWTQEECDEILKHQQEHGNEWKALAEELGRHRFHVKDTWRRIKLRNRKKGQWSQEEYQKLFDLVNSDLLLKVSEEKKSKYGMLRDNVCWTAISDVLATRSQAACCLKWYKQLTSTMVAEGAWADTDDYRLIGALYSIDATCIEDVDWDNLIDDRTRYVCRKRWNQMVLHIGQHGNKSFAEQVEILAQRYCPHLLEAREAWDSKPKVP
ncbi:hypothetical protein DH2020_039845 [Rehmannia glutinosa]|uniref:Myb-like domain-containing protein n=1 Tax=Rehmannia glutinosa TaxID=99300 RepID=A0ABR0UUM5_REHGL